MHFLIAVCALRRVSDSIIAAAVYGTYAARRRSFYINFQLVSVDINMPIPSSAGKGHAAPNSVCKS